MCDYKKKLLAIGACALLGAVMITGSVSATPQAVDAIETKDTQWTTYAFGKIAAFSQYTDIVASDKFTTAAQTVIDAIAKNKENSGELSTIVAETFWKLLIFKAIEEFVADFFNDLTKITGTKTKEAVQTELLAKLPKTITSEDGKTTYTVEVKTTPTLSVKVTAAGSSDSLVELNEANKNIADLTTVVSTVTEALSKAWDFVAAMITIIDKKENEANILVFYNATPVAKVGSKLLTLKMIIETTTYDIISFIKVASQQVLDTAIAHAQTLCATHNGKGTAALNDAKDKAQSSLRTSLKNKITSKAASAATGLAAKYA